MKEKHKKETVLHKNRGIITIAVIVIALIIAVILLQYDPELSQQKTISAAQLYESNKSTIADFRLIVEEAKLEAYQTTLDDDYIASTSSDLDWLTEEQENIYNKRAGADFYPKEAAFTLVAQVILQINENYVIEFGNEDYDTAISTAKELDYNIPKFLTKEEMDDAFTTEKEKELFDEEINYLIGKYIEGKKNLIGKAASVERQYVEAKKLILLSYSLSDDSEN